MPQGVVTIDARPSDAIALALRTGTRVFVEESVMQSVKKDADTGVADVGRLQKWLEGLSDDELGKYKM
jgi:bifunctional DNase/RNase